MQVDSSKIRGIVSASVMDERERQEAKWGEQNHEPAKYFAILAEEFGEAAEAVVHLTFGGALKLKDGTVLTTKAELEKHYMEELVQVAAVAQAMVESVLRRKMLEAVTRETDWEVIDKPSNGDPMAPRTLGVKKRNPEGFWFGVYVEIPELYEMEYNPANIVAALKTYVGSRPDLCAIKENQPLPRVELNFLMSHLQGFDHAKHSS